MQTLRNITKAAAFSALVLVAACASEPENIGAPVDPQAEALKNAPPVELPPSQIASRAYRCADNSLFYVEFFNNNTARIGTERNGERTQLRAAAEGEPYTAEGYSVSGSGNENRITAPGKPAQNCHT